MEIKETIDYTEKVKEVWTVDAPGTQGFLNALLEQYTGRHEELYYRIICGVPV